MFSGCRRPAPSRLGSCCGSCWPLNPQAPGSSALSVWDVRAAASGWDTEGGGSGFPGLARHLHLPMRLVGRDAGLDVSGSPLPLGKAPAPHTGRSQCPCRSRQLQCRPSPDCPGSQSRRCPVGTGRDCCLLGAGRESPVGGSAVVVEAFRSGSRSCRTLSEAPHASAPRDPGTAPGQVRAMPHSNHAETQSRANAHKVS